MFTHKHYVPILKTKDGEKRSIKHLLASQRNPITPLFEIHAHKTVDLFTHSKAMCAEVLDAWGAASPMFLDTCWLHSSAGDPRVINAVYSPAYLNDLKAIPIATLSYSDASLNEIANVVRTHQRGWMLRISPAESHNATRINQVIAMIGVPKSEIDLLLDYKNSAMNLPVNITGLPNLSDWRTFTASSAGFPQSIGGLPSGGWHRFARADWQSFNLGLATGLARKPTYGDYALRDSGPPPSGGEPSVSLRYSYDDSWMARVEGKHKLGHSVQMHTICSDLITMPEYPTRHFSQGDEEIYKTAHHLKGPGGPGQWVQWSVNHHIVLAGQQCLSLP